MDYSDVAKLFERLATLLGTKVETSLCTCPQCDPKIKKTGEILTTWLRETKVSPVDLGQAAMKLRALGEQLKPLVPKGVPTTPR